MEHAGRTNVAGSGGRARISVHIGVELIPLPLLEGLLEDDGDIGTFDEAKQYCIRSFIPPKRTALATLIEKADMLIGVSWLQERSRTGFSHGGLARSFTRVTSVTPWLKVVNMPDRMMKKIGMPLHEPVYIRVHPPKPAETRVFECVVEFNNGSVAQLSEIADFAGPDENNARIVLTPLDAWDRQYLAGLNAFPEMRALFESEGVDLAARDTAQPVRLVSPIARRRQDALPAPSNVISLEAAKGA
jgi:hypothetical protein